MCLSSHLLWIGKFRNTISLKVGNHFSFVFLSTSSDMRCKQFYHVAIKKINWIRQHRGNYTHSVCSRFITNIYFFSAFVFSDNSEDLDDSTTLKVHFKDLTCIKYRRDMYMTWDGLFGKYIYIYIKLSLSQWKVLSQLESNCLELKTKI